MKSINFYKTTILFFILTASIISVQAQSTQSLQQQFVDMRFGAFFHFGIRTFTGGAWGEANQDISKFNPVKLDCEQWAKALVSAKMKFGILTTKHHDGFCLWDSKFTDYDVTNTPWKNGKGDVLREYVDSFRKHGLDPSFYYSIWDSTAGIGDGPITKDEMDIIKGQITEILSNYGDIKMLFLDGWSWKMGHKALPYSEIRDLVKKLQPGCILIDNTHLRCLYNNDMIHFEDGSSCPLNNIKPAIQSLLINKNSGNGWFWDERVPEAELFSVNEIVYDYLNYLEPRWCTFILNCPPNPDGLLDRNIVSRLEEVGKNWFPFDYRPALPKNINSFIELPIIAEDAEATSGNAKLAIDGKNDRYYYSVWESDTLLPQSITIDLGKIHKKISTLAYVPKYIPIIQPQKDGSITQYEIYSSVDGSSYTKIAEGKWNGDENMKTVDLPLTEARYIKIKILSAIKGFAAATEFILGESK